LKYQRCQDDGAAALGELMYVWCTRSGARKKLTNSIALLPIVFVCDNMAFYGDYTPATMWQKLSDVKTKNAGFVT